MRAALGLLLSVAVLLGCANTPSPPPSPPPGVISCQPFGYTPAPIPFSFAPGRVTASAAEQTAVALFRACLLPTATISDLTSSSVAATGSPHGPNAGQAVWRVQVDATITDASTGEGHQSHFVIEVNEATGVPTVVAYG